MKLLRRRKSKPLPQVTKTPPPPPRIATSPQGRVWRITVQNGCAVLERQEQ